MGVGVSLVAGPTADASATVHRESTSAHGSTLVQGLPVVALSRGVRSLDVETAVRRLIHDFPACDDRRCFLVGGRRLHLRVARLIRKRDPLPPHYFFRCRRVPRRLDPR